MTTHDRRRQTGHSRTTTAVMDARYWPTEKAYAALAAVADDPHGPGFTGGPSMTTGEPVAEQAAVLMRVAQLHDQWGDTRTDELDPLDMWEQLGRVLGAIA